MGERGTEGVLGTEGFQKKSWEGVKGKVCALLSKW